MDVFTIKRCRSVPKIIKSVQAFWRYTQKMWACKRNGLLFGPLCSVWVYRRLRRCYRVVSCRDHQNNDTDGRQLISKEQQAREIVIQSNLIHPLSLGRPGGSVQLRPRSRPSEIIWRRSARCTDVTLCMISCAVTTNNHVRERNSICVCR